jgi:cytochrome P450
MLLNVPVVVPGSPRWRGRRGKEWIDTRLLANIRAARASAPGKGLLSALVHGKGAEGETLTDLELVDNLRLLMLAGHETSASTMAWMLGLLAERPDAWARLCDEARALGRVPTTAAELKQLPFTEAVFREALRLYPPVAFDSRRLTDDLEIHGRVIPKNTVVGIPIMHLSRHPELQDRHDEFVPDRWLAKREAVSPMELIQFGGGPHFCLGYHLAWMEIMQFASALALALGELELRPRLASKPASPRYLPLLHPSMSLRVAFE